MNIKNAKYFKSHPILSEPNWVQITLNDSDELISAKISDTEKESPVWDIVKKKVEAEELTIAPADEEE